MLFSFPHCKTALLLIISFFISISPLHARPLDDNDLKQLEETSESYKNALQSKNIKVLMDAYPPQAINALAKKANVTPDQIRQAIYNQLILFVSKAVIENIDINLKEKSIGNLDNGDPYALLPFSARVTTPEKGRIDVKSTIVALNISNRWYLVRADNQQFSAIMKSVFPGFEKIVVPAPQAAPAKSNK